MRALQWYREIRYRLAKTHIVSIGFVFASSAVVPRNTVPTSKNSHRKHRLRFCERVFGYIYSRILTTICKNYPMLADRRHANPTRALGAARGARLGNQAISVIWGELTAVVSFIPFTWHYCWNLWKKLLENRRSTW